MVDIASSGLFQFFINENLANDFYEDEEVRDELTKLATEAVEYARNLAPIGETGNLSASIRFTGFIEEEGNLYAVVEVGEGAEYWIFVEYGTGQRGASSSQPEPGLPAGYTHGDVMGVPARPYMRPTILWLQSRVGD